jgi:hypothetical protein
MILYFSCKGGSQIEFLMARHQPSAAAKVAAELELAASLRSQLRGRANPAASGSKAGSMHRLFVLAAVATASHLGDRICVAYGQMVTVDWRSGGGDTEAANDEGWDEEVQEWTSWSDCSCECGADMRASQRQF